MIGNSYWSTGITVKHNPELGWLASLDFFDDGFAEQGSTEGKLHTRYWSKDASEASLACQIDVLRADAERFGVVFRMAGDDPPNLYYQGDGEDPEWPPPDGWRELLRRQAARLDWRGPYLEEELGPKEVTR